MYQQRTVSTVDVAPGAKLRGLKVLDFLIIMEDLSDGSSWIEELKCAQQRCLNSEGDLSDHEADSGNLNGLGMNLFRCWTLVQSQTNFIGWDAGST